MSGRFIVLEGIDGSGKSTQAEILAARLKKQGANAYLTREPSDGVIGKLLRRALSGELQMSEQVMAALFAADRLEHLTNAETGVLRYLKNDTQVICDRYYLSTYAYQSVAVDLDWTMALNKQAALMAKPDVHIFLDIAVDTALARIARNREHMDIYETKERLEETRTRYLEVIGKLKDTENIVIINAEQSPEEIARDIWESVKYLF